MVVTKVHQIKTSAGLGRSIQYILNDAKTISPEVTGDFDFPLIVRDGQVGQQLISGHDVTNLKAADVEFTLTKQLADRRMGRDRQSDLVTGKGVLAHHIIQSFSPEDNLSAEEIHAIGRQTVMELTGGNHSFVIATHMDQDHIHNHIIFNATSNVDLKKFRWQKGTKKSLEKISDKHADLAGAKIIEPKAAVFDHKAYAAYQKKSVYKLDIKSRLEFLLKQSLNLEDFKAKAKVLNLQVDFSGKYAKYKLLDRDQQRNTRDSTLSKRGRYSMAAIAERLSKNEAAYSLEDIKQAYDQEQADKADDFEMRLFVKKDQVSEESQTGIYLQVDYGLRNTGTIKIPYRQVEKTEEGDFEVFIKHSDFFYFINPDHSENNRFMRGDTLVKQLAHASGEYIVRRHHHLNDLDHLIKEFEFLVAYDVTDGSQFEELSDRFNEQLDQTEDSLDRLDQRLATLNRVLASISELDGSEHTDVTRQVLLENGLAPQMTLSELEKEVLEIQVERDSLRERYEEIMTNFETYEEVKDNAKERQREEEQGLER
ncbi:relaxase/mobilization nuclease domain-containing protein [Streptococcus dentiloxodontae]